MASFAQFLGRKVTVQYRVGDILMPASGTFAADSGRSIFLEQHMEQRGNQSYFRWEIPYQFIHRIELIEVNTDVTSHSNSQNPEKPAQVAVAGASSDSQSILSLPQRAKTA